MEITTRFSIGDRVLVNKDDYETPVWATVDTVSAMYFMCGDQLAEGIDYIADNDGERICFNEKDAYASMEEFNQKNKQL